jgi:hypothetical protein
MRSQTTKGQRAATCAEDLYDEDLYDEATVLAGVVQS